MTKAGEELIKAATEALEIAHGQADPENYRVHLPDEINARLIRSQLNMTQGVFAQTFGIDIRTPSGLGTRPADSQWSGASTFENHLPGARGC